MGRHKMPTRRIGNRNRWLAASSIAMATAMLHPGAAQAQSTTNGVAVRAQAQYATGAVTYTPGTPTPAGTATDTVRVNTANTLINWVPYDTATGGGPITFLPAGNGLFYISDAGNYTVVNRILPTDATRAVRFDGQVASFVNNGSAIGGNVFFFSPGGIIVGGTGRFDVGSLVLTTSEITQTVATSTTLAFAPATQADSKITIEPWAPTGAGDVSAQLQTMGGNSYLALMAPTVEMFGRVDAPGNVAYVAAESATMTISGSLFDIVVNTGTTSATGVEHTGTTTGSAYGGPSRRIQMVAVPKNVALTMLVSGSVGYQAASSAGIVGGNIVLTAGSPGGIDANIDIREANFIRPVTASASNDIRISADGAGDAVVVDDGVNAYDFTATAGGNISVELTNGAGLSVGGDLSLRAGNGDTGGDITIKADAAGVTGPESNNGIEVGGNLTLDTSASGVINASAGGIGTDAVAGNIAISLTESAQFTVGGDLTVDTSARAGFGDARSGDATAGSFTFEASGAAGNVTVGGLTDVDARALAAISPVDGGPAFGQEGGDATGGDVSFVFNGVDTLFTDAIEVDTGATASSGRDSAVAQDNSATAGDISLAFTGGTHNIFYLDLDAVGTAGLSFDGAGNGVAGTVGRALVDIALDGAILITDDDNTIDASTSGDISASAPADAITLTAINGSSFTSGYFEAETTHDNVDSTNPGAAGGIAVTADNSTLALGLLTLQANALASSSVAADKSGGAITVTASNGSTITANGASLNSGVNEPIDAVGPSVNTGGAISLIAADSDIAFTGGTQLDASVDVSRGGDGSAAPSTGGAITIRQTGANSDLTFNDLSVSTAAALPDGGSTDFLGNGGNAAGGTVTVDVLGGNFTADSLLISTFATGQTGGSQIAAAGDLAGDGGSARSGDILVTAAGTSFDPGVVGLFNTASGGVGGTGLAANGAGGAGAGGAATAGDVVFDLLAGTVNLEAFIVTLPPIEVIGPVIGPLIPTLNIGSAAVGGTGGFGDATPGGAGGAATGGTTIFNAAGADVTIDTAALALFSGAYGGAGGNTQPDSSSGISAGTAGAGGTATGGTATYLFTGGTTNITSAMVDASAFGGIGGDQTGFSADPLSAGGMGGSAFGGTATITLGADDTSSALYTVTARATGGDGGDGSAAGAGGEAEGGAAQFNVDDANVNAYSIGVDASAYGGDGGYPYLGGRAGGAGGNATGGTAGIDVFGLAAALTTDQGIDISSTGVGGDGAQGSYLGDGGAGGFGRGGSIVIAARDGANFELFTSDVVDAGGRGGDGGPAGSYDGNPPGAGGAGGAGYGGSIDISASGATLAASSVEGPVQFSAAGSGGVGGDSGYGYYGYYGYYGSQGTLGGNGFSIGGSVSLGAFGAGLFQVTGDLVADANGVGRVDARAGSTGSDATGGAVRIDIDGGGAFTVTGNATLEATALATLGQDTLGSASGGTVDVTMNGAGSLLDIDGSLTADASAIDNRTGGSFFGRATGGGTTGGQVTLDFLEGTATIAGTLELFAMAGVETSEGTVFGGSATGGAISLLNDGAAELSFVDLAIDASARGGDGSRPSGGAPGEAGADAFAGEVTLSNRGTGSLTATSITIDAGARGGYGGNGAEGYYGAGGAGGNAVGGTVLVASGSTMSVQDLTVVADAIGGQGGSGAGGFDGGAGGQGEGGAITFATSATIANLNQLSLSATGTGGIGAIGDGYYGYYGQGSRGGDGAGGSILIDIAGVGTTLSGLATFQADTDGTGGSGGTGASSYGDGGDGGTGGDATGGSLTIMARSGALIDLSSTGSLDSNGNGGAGGDGGAGGYADGTGSYGGDGGAGGNGTGGSVTLIAQGGAITGGTIQFTASGYGGRAGYGGTGYYDYGTYGGGVGGRLAGGSGTGGLVSLQALEGSPGTITLGAVTIDASGILGGSGVVIPTVGGSIEIIDASTDPAGLITMDLLIATALGALSPADASFTMSGDSGPITILNALSVNVVGDIVFDFDGSGRLVVGGTTFLNAGGDILLTHSNNAAGAASIDSTGDFTATSGGAFSAGSGSIANGGGNVSITAQDIAYDAIEALGFVRLNALTGSIGFAGTGTITAGSLIDLDAAQAVTIGDADAETGFTINAGGDVAFGTITNSGSDLSIVAGGSIGGASAINDAPLGSGGLSRTILTAGGDIALTGAAQSVKDGVFLSASGNIVAGTIDAGINAQALANGTVAVGTVNSGTGALLQGTSVTLDNGSVGGNLVVTATSGSIGGSGTITVGGTADFDAPASISFGSLTAGAGFTANTGGDIAFDFAGTTGGDLAFAAGGSVLGGDLDVAGLLSLTGALIAIGNASGTTLALGSTSDILFDSLTSPNAISLTAANGTIGANAGPGDIDSGGDVSLDARVVSVGNVTSGGSVNAVASAGDASFGTIDAAADITVTATGTPSIANAISGGNTTITGASVTLNNGAVGGNLRLNATAGDIDGSGAITVGGGIDFDATGDIAFGTLAAQGGAFTVDAGGAIAFTGATGSDAITMNAGGAILGGDLDAGGALGLSGASVAIGDASAASIGISSGSDIRFDSLSSPASVILSATNGAIGANSGPGDIDSGGGVSLVAQDIALGDVTAAGGVGALASTGDASFATIDAGGDVTITAAGTPTVANVISGGDTSITGSTIAFNNGTVGGALRLNATAGDIDGTGVVTVGGAIDFDATGNIAFGSLGAGGDFTVDAGGAIDFVGASTTQGVVAMNAGGAITGGNVSSAVTVVSDDVTFAAGGGLSLGNVSAGDGLSLTGATVTAGDLTASNGSVSVASPGAANLGFLSATGGIGVTAASIGLTGAGAGAGLLRLAATAGDLVATGDMTTSGPADLDSDGALAMEGLSAGGAISLDSGGAMSFTGVTSTGGAIAIRGANVAGTSVTTSANASVDDRITIAAAGTITIGVVDSGDSIDVTGAAAVIGQLLAGTGISVDTGGVASFGFARSGADTSIEGGSVRLTSGTIGGALTLSAAAGDLNATGTINAGGAIDLGATGNISFGSLAANGGGFAADAGGEIGFGSASAAADLTMTAGGAIEGGDLSAADGTLTLDGGLIAIGNASANAIAFTSASDILFDLLTSPNAIVLTALDGTIAANAGPGDIESDGDVALAAQAIDVNNVTSGGSVDATATTGGAGFGTIDSAGNITISAAGVPTVVNAISGGDTWITGSTIVFNNGAVGGLLRLNATAGDIDGTGTVSVGGAIDLDAAGNVTFGSLDAGGAFTVDAGGAITFVRAASPDSLTMNALGAITGGDLNVTGPLSLTGGTVAIGDAAADSIAFASNADILFGSLTVRGPLTLTAAGGTIGGGSGPGDILADGGVTLLAQALALGDVTSGGTLNATATTGDIELGQVTAAGLVALDATAGSIALGGAQAGGDFTANSLTGFAAGSNAIAADGDIVVATGGAADLGNSSAGGLIDVSASHIDFGALTAGGSIDLLTLQRPGGPAGDGGIVGAGLTAGTGGSSLDAFGSISVGGALDVGGSLAVSADGSASLGAVAVGTSLTGDAEGDFGFAAIDAGGDVALSAGGQVGTAAGGSGDIAGNAISIAAGSVDVGDIAASGSVGIAAGTTATFGDASAVAAVSVSAGSDLSFGAIAGSDIEVTAGAALAGGSLAAGGAITVAAGQTLTLESATAGDRLDLSAGSTLTIADAIGGTVALRSATGAVIVTNDIESTFSGDGQQVIVSGAAVQIDDVNDLLLTLVQATDGDIDAVAAGDIGVVEAESAGDINLASTGGDVRVSLAEAGKAGIVPATGGAIAPAGTQVGSPGPGNIAISAAGLAQGRFVASGDIGIVAGGTIDLDGADAGGAIALNSGGSTRVFGTVAAGGDIAIDSGADVRVTNSEASLEAGGDLAVQAAGTFDTQGFSYGASVAVTAGDVVIGASGKVGDAGLTTSVSFTGIGTINVGGDSVADNFSLDADEIGRIENSGDLTFRALNGNSTDSSGAIGTAAVNTGGPARIIIGDVSMVAGAGGQMGADSTLLLDSQGTIDILGGLTVGGAGADGSLRLRSNGATWLDIAGGNLRVEDASGAATGIIDIDSASFMAVSADALADIDGLSPADIEARLADNDGVVRSDGFVQAGTLEVRVDGSFFVQNSGDGDSSDLNTRRGFAVDILSVDTSEGSSPLIVINGVVGGQTGVDAVLAADIGAGFAAGSTINGCAIADPAACIPIAPPPPSEETHFDDPARDLIEEDFDPALELEGELESQLIDLAPPEEFEDDPLIDDPVTGAGNEDLWVGEPSCEPGSEGEAMCPTSREAQPEAEQDEQAMEPAE